MKVVRDKFFVERLQLVSSLAQQVSVQLWEYAIDREEEGTYWFWPSLSEEPGAMVHVGTILVGKRSEGYGGRWIEFPTKDGVVKIQGPWHSNADALFKRTGYDLRDKHKTVGVISLKRGMDGSETVLEDVVYMDPENGMIGTFDRIQKLAQIIANENDMVLFYYRKSSGGSSCGPVYPEQWNEEKKRKYFYKD